MNNKLTTNQVSGITSADVLYAFFRHKWKILIISLLAIIAAASLPFVTPRVYQSEAKLFVKYVVETKTPGQLGAGAATVDDGAYALDTEMEILTSLDLAQQVADIVGPDKVLAKAGGGTNRYAAADFIRHNLTPEATKGSKVIRVTFKHPDAQMVQPILNQVITSYLTRHEEIHRKVGAFDDYLTQQTDQLNSRLKETEDELRKAKTSAGIISLEDSKRAFSEQIETIRTKISDAEAELAERQSTAEEMAKLLHTVSPSAMTNGLEHSAELQVPPEKVAEYRKVSTLLEGLRKREQDLLLQFTPENSWVRQVQEQIATQAKLKEDLEAANPTLIGVHTGRDGGTSQDPTSGLRATLFTESARAKALQSKMAVLTGQLARIRKEAGSFDAAEASITELQRARQLQEKNYEYFKQNLEQSKFDQALGAGRNYNISIIQYPSPNFVVSKLPKTMAMIAFGGIAFAFGLALLIDLYLDKSVKRPTDVSQKLGLPVFMAIPRLALNGHKRLNGSNRALLTEASAEPAAVQPNGANGALKRSVTPKPDSSSNKAEVAPWDPKHVMRPFCETLRDRLIAFFDASNLTHKPKLVAVTSCSDGAGVSTVATGLAASLSETGEGNVLVVSMGEKDGSVHQFRRGDLDQGLEHVLEKENREGALVHDNLYAVSEPTYGDGLPVPLPRRFKNLVPKLRASDYDYIIFDMPAVSQISVTPRLARFMDFVVMVVESEHTNRDVVKNACAILTENKANVGVVVNKGRNYLPKWLKDDL
jgi:uncharacterized protein involved in exopolysaccharide biosynthesis/Mrp family chromosome partitioning ATPase